LREGLVAVNVASMVDAASLRILDDTPRKPI
jgi:hypothetical protein